MTEDAEVPRGEPVIVNVYVPIGRIDVVATVTVEVAPVTVGVTVGGDTMVVPHGLVPEPGAG